MLSWIRKRLDYIPHDMYWACCGSVIVHACIIIVIFWAPLSNDVLNITIFSQRRARGAAPVVFSPVRSRRSIGGNASAAKAAPSKRTNETPPGSKSGKNGIKKRSKKIVQSRKMSQQRPASAQRRPMSQRKKRVDPVKVVPEKYPQTPWTLPPDPEPEMSARVQEIVADTKKEQEITPLATPVMQTEEAIPDPGVPGDVVEQSFMDEEFSGADSVVAQHLQVALTESFAGIPGIDIEKKVTFTIRFMGGENLKIDYGDLTGIPAYDIQLKSFIHQQVSSLHEEYKVYDKPIKITLFLS